MLRIPLLDFADMTPEQAEYHRTDPGGKLNIARLLAQAPACMAGFSMLANAIFAKLQIPPQEREIVVLAVAALQNCAYEWAQHDQIARDMEIPEAKIAAIATHRYADRSFTQRERALIEFTRQTVQNVNVDDPAFDAVAAFYDPRQLVELLFTIGAYMMLARLMEVARLEVDAVSGAEVVRQAVAKAKQA
jgi:AhpD family alkylhydroperoxidase